MKPSDFKIHPWNSTAGSYEAETVARNIITILARTGDEWRPLDWAEYKAERLEDGNFSERERNYFDQVIGYCKSADTAVLFSPTWKEAATQTSPPPGTRGGSGFERRRVARLASPD